ncbi:hypothetical protein [Methylocystis iwaonis]|uniref:hypothetical protein n=1 Tax=Methylocystis iwaonis TaxID=2885079 RepID=UPI00249235B8|nr:hypothetical protein [Methylocystis iwaonis]
MCAQRVPHPVFGGDRRERTIFGPELCILGPKIGNRFPAVIQLKKRPELLNCQPLAELLDGGNA